MIDLSKLKVVLFDVGNTLYRNKNFRIAYRESLYKLIGRRWGLTDEGAVNLFKNRRSELKQGKEEHITKTAVMESLGFTRQEVHDAYFRVDPGDYLDPDPRLRGMLSMMKKHYRLGIVSNDQTRMIKRILNALEIDEKIFDLIQGEEMTEKRKPDPEPLEHALKTLKVNPSQACYVADSYRKDLLPAKLIGMQTVLVGLTEKEVDGQIPSLYDLEKLLG